MIRAALIFSAIILVPELLCTTLIIHDMGSQSLGIPIIAFFLVGSCGTMLSPFFR
jgi:hypothetical protein